MSIDNFVKSIRIQENIITWETTKAKYKNIPYNPSVATFIRNNTPIRMIINQNDTIKNEKKAYILAKHLINAGIAPSRVCIVSLEDCYLSVRGFGDNASTKESIFKHDNELIIIDSMREIRQTDVKDNVYSFWQEFWAYCRKNKELNVLLVFDNNNGKDWYPRETDKAPHRDLNFLYG